MESLDGLVKVELSGALSSEMPQDSCFPSIVEASKFFESGSVGYSATKDRQRLDGIRLKTEKWKVDPLDVHRVSSTYFSDNSLFPTGTSSFDCALIMQNIRHEWRAENDLYVEPAD